MSLWYIGPRALVLFPCNSLFAILKLSEGGLRAMAWESWRHGSELEAGVTRLCRPYQRFIPPHLIASPRHLTSRNELVWLEGGKLAVFNSARAKSNLLFALGGIR
jgi:hypothetical protein